GLATGEPLYVIAIEAERNAVVVGPRAALESPGLVTEPAHWLMPAAPREPFRARIRIRSHHAAAAATVHPLENGAIEALFDEPQSAVTPGQLAVFYDGEHVLGGAPIAAAIRERTAEPALAVRGTASPA